MEIILTPETEWHGEVLVTLRMSDPPASEIENDPVRWVEIRTPEGEFIRREVEVLLDGEGVAWEEALRRAGGNLARWLAGHATREAGLPLAQLTATRASRPIAAFCEGLLLGGFRMTRYLTGWGSGHPTTVHLLCQAGAEQAAAELERAIAIAEGVNLAREWALEPANCINPVSLAERAQALAAACGFDCHIFDEQELAELGAGALLAVGQGSLTPARLIVLEYPGAEQPRCTSPVVLVGKTITFDGGGYNMKTSDGMRSMKLDKCGGMDVLGVFRTISALKLDVHLVGILAAAENMVSDRAFRPKDVVTSLAGKTIEVTSTDSEGRLVLADGLTYALNTFQPKALIDLATLTGSARAALGSERSVVFSNDEGLYERLNAAGERTCERLWQLPLAEEYLYRLKSEMADLKNYPGDEAGAIMGGLFLKQFIPDGVPWAHIDLSAASSDHDRPYIPAGATGFGVRLLVDYLEGLL